MKPLVVFNFQVRETKINIDEVFSQKSDTLLRFRFFVVILEVVPGLFLSSS